MSAVRTPLAGKKFMVRHPDAPGSSELVVFEVEEYWDTLTGGSWMYAEGNFACMKFAIRSGFAGLPLDNEVVYGKIGPFGHLFHVSELTEEVTE